MDRARLGRARRRSIGFALCACLVARPELARAHAQPARVHPQGSESVSAAQSELAAAQAAEQSGDRASARAHAAAGIAKLVDTAASDADVASLVKLGDLARRMGALPEAKAALARAVELRSRSLAPDDADLLRTKLLLASALGNLGELEAARALQEEVVHRYASTRPPEDQALLLARGNLAVTRNAMGDRAGARAIYEELLRVYERTLSPDDPERLRVQHNLANILTAAGDSARSRELHERVVAGYERTLPPDHPNLWIARMNLAGALAALEDLGASRALMETVTDHYERTLPEDHPDRARAWVNLAGVLRQAGDSARATELFERAVASFERMLPPDHPDLLEARSSLALQYVYDLDPEAARDILESVIAAAERILSPDDPTLTAARSGLAAALRQTGGLERAREMETALLAAAEDRFSPRHPEVLLARANLAMTLKELGERAAACTELERVCEGYEAIARVDHPHLLSARMVIARMRVEQGDLARAREELAKLGRGLLVQLDGAAVVSAREARERVQSARAPASAVAFASMLPDATDGERELAFEVFETVRAVASQGPRVADAVARDAALQGLARELTEARSRLQDRVIEAAAGADATELERDVERLSAERDRIERTLRAKLAESGARSAPIRAKTLSAALGADAAFVAFVRHNPWRWNRDEGVVRSDEARYVAHVLARDRAPVLVDLGPAEAIHELVAEWRASIGEGLAARGVAATTETEPADAEARDAVAARLAEKLVVPLFSHLEGVKRLHVVPDDALFLVPLDALPVGDGVLAGERFAIRVESSAARLVTRARESDLAPGARANDVGPGARERELATARAGDLVTGVRARGIREAELVVLGGIDYGGAGATTAVATRPSDSGTAAAPERTDAEAGDRGPFAPLPGARLEVERIAALFAERFEREAVVLCDAGATKLALRERAPGASFLHVATHGYFAPDSVRSIADDSADERREAAMRSQDVVIGFAPMTLCGLALAGANRGRDSLGRVEGILTAEELCAMDLSRCELAVLSACETNVGIRRAGQGIQSLQAALHAAGAECAITSLWKVDDERTRELFEDFYARIWERGESKATALWNAKMKLRAKGAPVRDWSAWVMTGASD